MSDRDPWWWWADKLAGKNPQMNPGNPRAGFYRMPRKAFYGARKTFTPVAYWPGTNGRMMCRYGDDDVTPERGEEIWERVGNHPVSEQAYRAVAQDNKPWPDEHEGLELADEEWRRFENTDYEVSNLGRVRRIGGVPLIPRKQPNGYLRVHLGADREEFIHRMVLTAFVGPCPEGCETDHLDKDRADNTLENLRWLPKAENLANREIARGEAQGSAKLTEAQVRLIKSGPFYRGRDTDLAETFGVSRETVRDIRNGKDWAHITVEEELPESHLSNFPPPDDSIDQLRDEIEEYARTAEKRLDGPAIETQDEADRIANLADRLAELHKKADDLRKAERRPHDEALKAIQLKWVNVLLKAETYKNLKYKLLTPWLTRLQEAQKKEAEAAAAAGEPAAASARRPRAGTRGRAQTLKTFKRAEIEDYEMALAFFKESQDVKNLVQELANRAVRAGITVPGTKVIEEQKAV